MRGCAQSIRLSAFSTLSTVNQMQSRPWSHPSSISTSCLYKATPVSSQQGWTWERGYICTKSTCPLGALRVVTFPWISNLKSPKSTSAHRSIGDFRRRGAENERTVQYHDRIQYDTPLESISSMPIAVQLNIIFLFESWCSCLHPASGSSLRRLYIYQGSRCVRSPSL